MSRFKWVFFDWGGTLKDEIAIYRRVAKSVIEFLGERDVVVCEDALFSRLIELERSDEAMRIDKALSDLGCRVSDIDAVTDAVDPSEITHPSPSYPGAEAVLIELQTRYRLGVISNHRKGLDLRLQMDSLGKYFELAIGSGDVGVRKPDRKIFKLALDRAGCLPTEAAMVGDRLSKDIAGANSVGMFTVHVRQGIYDDQMPGIPDEEPDVTITDIRDLLSMLP